MKKTATCDCHICKTRFSIELDKGGLCENCRKPTCNRHLTSHTVNEKELYICSNCLAKSTAM